MKSILKTLDDVLNGNSNCAKLNSSLLNEGRVVINESGTEFSTPSESLRTPIGAVIVSALATKCYSDLLVTNRNGNVSVYDKSTNCLIATRTENGYLTVLISDGSQCVAYKDGYSTGRICDELESKFMDSNVTIAGLLSLQLQTCLITPSLNNRVILNSLIQSLISVGVTEEVVLREATKELNKLSLTYGDDAAVLLIEGHITSKPKLNLIT